MMVYLVIQEGIYRHDVRGVFATKLGAVRTAIRAAQEDGDAYHLYQVYETPLGAYVADAYPTPDLPAFRRALPNAEPEPDVHLVWTRCKCMLKSWGRSIEFACPIHAFEAAP